MKKHLLFALTLTCLFTVNSYAQRRASKPTKATVVPDVVCQGAPMPEGYVVVSDAALPGCGGNPLNNAFRIAKAGSVPSFAPASTSRRTLNRGYDEDEQDTVRQSSPRVSPSSTSNARDSFGDPSVGLPSTEEIDVAVRQSKVIVGMNTQDVSRAWGHRHTNDMSIGEGGSIHIWRYRRGEVRFRNGVVYEVALLRN